MTQARGPNVLEQLFHESERRFRRRIAAIEPGVNRDAHARAATQLHRGEEMLVERMHATGTDESHEVQRGVVASYVVHQLHEGGNSKELAGVNRLRNAHDVLRHDATGAEIQMTDFTVADLSFGESDGESRGIEQRTRRALPQAVPGRRLAQLDRVAFATGTKAPTVEHDQDNRTVRPVRDARAPARCHIEGDAS